MKRIVFIVMFILGITTQTNAQTTNLREVFLAAESYFLFEEFNEALPLYLRVHRHYPDNDNVNFKIGVCYLNNPYEKDKSIFYLEKAAQNITLRYRDNNFRETSAPLEALFYLGNAYRINNKFEKARESYNNFLEQLDPKLFDEELVKDQLKTLDVAESLMKRPVDHDYQILSDKINSRFSDIRAVISGNEKHLVYVSRLQFYDAVFHCEKINGEWSAPRNIIPELGVDGDVYPTSLSWDGSELYIYRSDDFIGNIYVTKLTQGKWSPIVKLNDNINTKFWESHASINKEGNKLYFTSNRRGGLGGLDIYVSERSRNGDWGSPVNLGPKINTKYNEETPFITEDGKRLFFSSYGHYNMGGYDVFVSILNEDGKWAEPRNLGYPINTTQDDLFFHPYRNGRFAMYPRFKEDGFGRFDIYNYQVYSHEFPRMYLITGQMDYSGADIDSTDILISVLNVKTKDTVTILNPDSEGTFQFNVPAGSYDMFFKSSKFHEYMQRLEVNQNTPHSGLAIAEKIALTPIPVLLSQEERDKMLTLRDTFISVDSDKTTRLRFNAERGANIIVNVYNDSLLIVSDTIDSARRRESFDFKPQPGTNIVEFTVVDKDGNTVTKKAEVLFDKPAPIEKEKGRDIEVLKDEKTKVEIQKIEETKTFKDLLQNYAEGNLKTFLEKLDLNKEDITTKEDLISYLREQADKNDYALEDVNQMLEKASGSHDLLRFLQNLTRVSKGNLKNTLLDFNPSEKNIFTPFELTDHLLNNAGVYRFEQTDLINSLGILASGEINDPIAFLEELKENSDGILKQYLQSITPSSITNTTPGELAVSIYNQADNQGFNSKEFAQLLTEMATFKDVNKFRNDLANLAGEDLKKAINSLNLKDLGIKSSNDLINYLYKNSGTLNYSTRDLDLLLSELALQNQREIQGLLDQMLSASTGPLQKFLKEMNLNDFSFSSREEFLSFLFANAESGGYTKDDVNNALLKLAYDGDISDIIAKLSRLAEGNLKKTLLNLDPSKENINDFNELIQYLLDNTKKHNYSEEDVFNLLKKYFALTDAEQFLRKLISISEGEINEYLKEIDLINLNILNRQQLMNHLLTDGDKGLINKESIIRLILKAEDIPAAQILPDLKAISHPSIIKLIEEAEKDNSLISAHQVFDYLLDAAISAADVGNKDILDLFSDYLRNYEFKRFLHKLTEKSEKGLREALLQIDIKRDQINNMNDLIDYLLSKAYEFNYTHKDVFNLIQSVLSEENLYDFIRRIIPLTTGNLRELLLKLDLKESGINSIGELIEFLIRNAEKYNYDPTDIWNSILKMVISDDKVQEKEIIPDLSKPKNIFLRNLTYTGLIFITLGLIILFFIWWERKKKKKKPA